MERKKILVAFADVQGSTRFNRRAAPEEKSPMIQFMYDELEKMIDPSEYFSKYDGDGIMLVKEVGRTPSYEVIRDFILKSYASTLKINNYIKEVSPRPDGFAVRWTMGMAFKLHVKNPYGGTPKLVPEYVDYPVDLAKRLFAVYPGYMAICTGNIAEIIRKNKNGIQIRTLDKPLEIPKGIDADDTTDLAAVFVDNADAHN